MVIDIQGRALNVKYIESVGEIKKETRFIAEYAYEETGRHEFYVYMVSGEKHKYTADTKEMCDSKRDEFIALMMAEEQ